MLHCINYLQPGTHHKPRLDGHALGTFLNFIQISMLEADWIAPQKSPR